MGQVNVNTPPTRDEGTGVGTVLAVLLVLALVAFLVWALAFGGMNTFSAAPAGDNVGTTTTAPRGDTNVNVQPPNVNVNVPNPSGGNAPAGNTTGGTTSGTTNTAPSKP